MLVIRLEFNSSSEVIVRLFAALIVPVLGAATASASPELHSGAHAARAGVGAYDCQESSDIVFEQIPDAVLGLFSQDDACYPLLAQTADDFVGTGEDLVAMGWWGLYWNGTALAPDGFRIEIYADDGGVPGDLLYETTTTEYNEVLGDSQMSEPSSYCTVLEPPFEMADGSTYHMSVIPLLCFPPQWGHSTGIGNGVPGHFRSVFFDFPEWTPNVDVFGFEWELALVLFASFSDPIPVDDVSWSAIKGLY